MNPDFIHNLAIHYSLEISAKSDTKINVSNKLNDALSHINEALRRVPKDTKYLQTKSIILLE